MVGTAQPLCLSASETDGRRYDITMNLGKSENHSASFHYLGWTARPFPLRLPVAGKAFLLTSPFIERAYRTNEVLLQISGKRRRKKSWAENKKPHASMFGGVGLFVS